MERNVIPMVILGFVFIIFLIYSIFPTIIFPKTSHKILVKGDSEDQVAITFDDGPSEKYTPRLLDLLKKYNVKVTFFIVGENAEANPELIRRIHREGHQIGLHHYRHTSNWFLFPKTIRKQCDLAAATVEKIIGVRPIYYRPPWGHLNLLIHQAARNYQMVLWSAILGDWRLKLGKDRLKKRIIKNLKGGSIIVLHDRGTNLGADEQAPEMMLSALSEVLESYHNCFRFVTVDELNSTLKHKEQTLTSTN